MFFFFFLVLYFHEMSCFTRHTDGQGSKMHALAMP